MHRKRSALEERVVLQLLIFSFHSPPFLSRHGLGDERKIKSDRVKRERSEEDARGKTPDAHAQLRLPRLEWTRCATVDPGCCA